MSEFLSFSEHASSGNKHQDWKDTEATSTAVFNEKHRSHIFLSHLFCLCTSFVFSLQKERQMSDAV